MRDEELLLREIQKHERTLDRVVQFQSDQAQLNLEVTQKLASNKTLIEKLQKELDSLKRLLDSMNGGSP